MSDLHRYGFAYGHYHPPIPHSEGDDPARAAFLSELAALRRQGQRYRPAPCQSHNDASTRNESYVGASDVWAPRICRICGGIVPGNRYSLCSEQCSKEANKRRLERWNQRALKAAIAAGEPARPCKVCGGPIPMVEHGRKVRVDTMTCGPVCRRAEYNRTRRERIARNRAAKAVAK